MSIFQDQNQQQSVFNQNPQQTQAQQPTQTPPAASPFQQQQPAAPQQPSATPQQVQVPAAQPAPPIQNTTSTPAPRKSQMSKISPFEWSPDRVTLIIYGSIAFVGTFMIFVIPSRTWLLFPIIVGVMQMLFGMTGFEPVRSIVASMMKKKPEEE